MASSSTPIPVRVIHPHAEPPAGLPIVELPMNAIDRRRVRRLVEAPDGVVLALELPTGTILHGNMHRDIYASGNDIIALADEVLAERLAKTGVPFDRARRPFHGRAPGEHSH